VAREAGLDNVGLDKVQFGPRRTTESGGDYYAVNPKGAVPALEIAPGEVLTEGAVIMQYLADQSAANLLPKSGMARYRVLELVNFVATELHKSFSPLFNPKITPEWRESVLDNIKKKFAQLEALLGDKQYLAGDFSIADAYAYTIIRWADAQKIDLPAKIAAYRDRVSQRAGVKQALAEEGLLAA
jgi:glutathione S-transferase